MKIHEALMSNKSFKRKEAIHWLIYSDDLQMFLKEKDKDSEIADPIVFDKDDMLADDWVVFETPCLEKPVFHFIGELQFFTSGRIRFTIDTERDIAPGKCYDLYVKTPPAVTEGDGESGQKG